MMRCNIHRTSCSFFALYRSVSRALAVVLAGGVAYVVQRAHTTVHWGVFRGEPADLRSVPAIVQDTTALEGRGIIQLGLLLLIATPVVRVAFSVMAFALQRDHTYVIITPIVFATLLYSLMGQSRSLLVELPTLGGTRKHANCIPAAE